MEHPPVRRPALSRFRDFVLGRRTGERDTAMSALGIVGHMQVARFEPDPLLDDVPPESPDDSYVDLPWELRDN